jgi:heme-degrading monooxygenase HmoA
MTIIQVNPENINKGVEIYRKSVLPEAKKQKGFRGACVLVDPKSGKCISVAFWKTEKDAIASEENLYYQEQLVKYLNLLAGPMIREGYEVRIHSIDSQAKPKPKKKPRPKKKGKK